MFTGEGVVAKIASFVVEKAGEKLLDLSFDKRRKACRSLTKLYFCLQTLDDVTEKMLETFDDFKANGDADAFVNALRSHSYEVGIATNMFVDLGVELQFGLDIIDPVLARCCSTLYVGKYDFLTYMSNSIKFEGYGRESKVTIKRPRGKMETVNMEDMYKQTKTSMEAGEVYYWPESALDNFAEDFEDVSIGFEDEEAARQLREMIVQQNKLLKVAKARVRRLLKDNFSVDEILFQADSRPSYR